MRCGNEIERNGQAFRVREQTPLGMLLFFRHDTFIRLIADGFQSIVKEFQLLIDFLGSRMSFVMCVEVVENTVDFRGRDTGVLRRLATIQILSQYQRTVMITRGRMNIGCKHRDR